MIGYASRGAHESIAAPAYVDAVRGAGFGGMGLLEHQAHVTSMFVWEE